VTRATIAKKPKVLLMDGAMEVPSAYFMMSPLVQYTDAEAQEMIEEFIKAEVSQMGQSCEAVERRKRVLFLCTGNSARSQMAEALVNQLLGHEWEACSAGTVPAGCVHPLVVEVMAELGIDTLRQRSKSVAEFRDSEFDVVITVCDQAANNCPLWLGAGQVKHMGFPDPAAASGSDDERLEVFRQVRDRIRREVTRYLEGWEEEAMEGVMRYDKTKGNL
jgi:arsenate reductase